MLHTKKALLITLTILSCIYMCACSNPFTQKKSESAKSSDDKVTKFFISTEQLNEENTASTPTGYAVEVNKILHHKNNSIGYIITDINDDKNAKTNVLIAPYEDIIDIEKALEDKSNTLIAYPMIIPYDETKIDEPYQECSTFMTDEGISGFGTDTDDVKNNNPWTFELYKITSYTVKDKGGKTILSKSNVSYEEDDSDDNQTVDFED